MTIREATDADVPRLVAMSARFLRETPYGALFPATDAQLDAFVAQARTLGEIFIADRDGATVGLFALVALAHPMNQVRYAEEVGFSIHPRYRGTTTAVHIAEELCRRAEDWAGTHGLRMVKIAAPTFYPQTGRFLQGMGYQAMETAYVRVL